MAQGLGEYGALSGGGVTGLTDVLDRVEYAVRDTAPSTWVALFAVVLVIWLVFFRSR